MNAGFVHDNMAKGNVVIETQREYGIQFLNNEYLNRNCSFR